MIADDAEPIPELGRDVKHRLAGADHRDVDQRAAAVHAEVEGAERYHGVIAIALRLQIGGMEIGRHQLDFGRGEPAEGRRLDRNDSDVDIGRRIAFGDIFAQPALLGWIVADHEGHADHRFLAVNARHYHCHCGTVINSST